MHVAAACGFQRHLQVIAPVNVEHEHVPTRSDQIGVVVASLRVLAPWCRKSGGLRVQKYCMPMHTVLECHGCALSARDACTGTGCEIRED